MTFNALTPAFTIIIFIIVFITCECKKKDILKSSNDLLQKEIARLSEENVKCSTKSPSESYLSALRVSKKVDKAIACYLYYLQDHKESGWHWSSLGQSYLDKGTSRFTSLSSNCFKQASKLSGKLNKSLKQWYFLGPFVIGKNEVDGDPAQFHGTIQELAKSRFDKKKIKFYSELVSGSEIKWEVQSGNPADYVQISPPINWNDLVNSLGSTGITEWQGWAVTEFAVNDNVHVIIQCLGVHTIFVDNIPMTGDVYRRDQFWFSVRLSKGIHTIYIRLRAKSTQVFKCSVDDAKNNFEILKPHFLPDIWKGYLFSNYISLPVANLHTSKWLKLIKVSVQYQSAGNEILADIVDSKAFPIAPGQIRPVVIKLSSNKEVIFESSCISVDLKIKFSTSDGQVVYPITLRCRKHSESFLFTFLDHDGSIQHGAAIHPIFTCPNDLCPVLLTLHGTTVPAQNQADSYKRMENEEFIFGSDKAWLLAPTRHGAHNWEGPGALTAMTALQQFCKTVSSKDWIEQKASCQHVLFAGHSMGGHGAWHLATHFPDIALGLASLAGWIKKEEYGDSNLFFRHDIANSHVDSSVKYIMESCIAENEADKLVSNLQGIPVIARIGANDRTIHPYFVRRMYRLLKEWKINVTYVEIPNKEHWWWDTRTTNDGGCVNDQQLQKFTNKYAVIEDFVSQKNSHDMYSEESQKEMKFTYTVMNPAFGGSYKGIQILQQIVPYRTSKIHIVISSHVITLTSENVAVFTIKEPHNRKIGWHKFSIQVDGINIDKELVADVSESTGLCLAHNKGTWDSCNNGFIGRNINTLGPARRIAEAKMLIVSGTQSSESVTQSLLEMAVYIANLFFLTSDTIVPVIKDTDLEENDASMYNLIIIGSPKENLYTDSVLQKVPPVIDNGEIQLGSCRFSAPRTGLLTMAPHGDERLALVLLGNSLDGLYDVISLASPTIPPMTRSPFSNMIPDYVITGPDFLGKGPGGYSCTGFWDNQWNFQVALSSCSC